VTDRAEFVVDPVAHRREIARFRAKVVQGPKPSDCDIWTGAIADSGYGRFWVNRPGGPVVISAHRYALALELGVIRAGDCARHVTCDNPVCVRSRRDDGAPHIVIGTQLDNMLDMARKGRGGRHLFMSMQARAARARALRAAVATGWNDAAVRAALMETGEPTLFD